jgi:hypothetical protein
MKCQCPASVRALPVELVSRGARLCPVRLGELAAPGNGETVLCREDAPGKTAGNDYAD